MKLVHHEIETTFDLIPQNINVLIVESEDKYFDYCSEVYRQINGGEGGFCLTEEDNALPLIKSCLFISDIFGLTCNDKKITTKFIQSLQEIVNERYVKEYSEIVTRLCELFDILNAESEYPIEYNIDEALQGLFKAFGIKLLEEGGVLERLVSFMKASSTFLKVKCLFFMNLKTILTSGQLIQLYHEAEQNEVSLFLFENTQRERLDGETITIIDRDLCEIAG